MTGSLIESTLFDYLDQSWRIEALCVWFFLYFVFNSGFYLSRLFVAWIFKIIMSCLNFRREKDADLFPVHIYFAWRLSQVISGIFHFQVSYDTKASCFIGMVTNFIFLILEIRYSENLLLRRKNLISYSLFTWGTLGLQNTIFYCI